MASQDADPNALFMDIALVNNMPKFKIIDHGYNFSKSKFMIQEENAKKPNGKFALFRPTRLLTFVPECALRTRTRVVSSPKLSAPNYLLQVAIRRVFQISTLQ